VKIALLTEFRLRFLGVVRLPTNHESQITNCQFHSWLRPFSTPGFAFHSASELAQLRRRAYAGAMAQPNCPLCGGTGWKTVERVADEERTKQVSTRAGNPADTPNAARPVWAVPCDCTGKDRIARAMGRAHIPTHYEDCDFENFDTDLYTGNVNFKADEAVAYNRTLNQAKLIVEVFARDYPLGSDKGLLLMGPCGAGKTHLAIAALRQLVLRGHSGLFYDYGELLRTIQDSYNPDSQATELAVLKPVLDAEVVVIDDLGSIKPSDWVREMVAHILNARYNAHRTTILTTMFKDQVMPVPSRDEYDSPDRHTRSISRMNRGTFRFPSGQEASPHVEDTLEKRIGQRIRSRLFEMCKTIELFAPDYRREVRHAGRVRS
jgi:DNA replication protein DnaC